MIHISTDKTKLDITSIHRFLSQSYWAEGRSIEMIQQSIEHSFCFGLYDNHLQIGFARVVSDCTIFAYIMDVFVLEEYQGQGLGLRLMNHILHESPALKDVQKWMLGTRDAHTLYKKVGFTALQFPERWMERL